MLSRGAEVVAEDVDQFGVGDSAGFADRSVGQVAAGFRWQFALHKDGVVVGSALVDALRASLDENGKATDRTVEAVASLARALASGVRSVRKAEAA